MDTSADKQPLTFCGTKILAITRPFTDTRPCKLPLRPCGEDGMEGMVLELTCFVGVGGGKEHAEAVSLVPVPLHALLKHIRLHNVVWH